MGKTVSLELGLECQGRDVSVAIVGRPTVREATEDPAVARLLGVLFCVGGTCVAALSGALHMVATPVDDSVALGVAVRLLATHVGRRHTGAVGKARLGCLRRLALAIAAHMRMR